MLLTAVFFFSPIAWLAAVLSKRDCEMACDERTINRMGIAKEEYGKNLAGFDSGKIKYRHIILPCSYDFTFLLWVKGSN